MKAERTGSRVGASQRNAETSRRRVQDQDEEEEEEEEEQNEAESPRTRKRARRNTIGEATDGPADRTASQEEDFHGTLPRDPKDNYISGSIVRVQLKNFVTYDYVEFHPGPYLNMILGPNGTGKSSIACAICLGLNFHPSVLGRADQITSYVKKGHKEGYIEIELKGPLGERNLVVRRNISSQTKNTTFTLNGKSASGREVSERIARLNIQVSNLCSFLPQDKVSEFARMNPQQLLRETQRAAGDKNLTEWHDTLISAGKELREIAEKLNADREQLKTMVERNALLERDVERFKLRKQIEKDIKLLELTIPFVEYLAAREQYKLAKEDQRAKHQRVQRLEALNKPAHDFKDEMIKQQKIFEKRREQKKSAIQRKLESLKRAYNENDSLNEKVDTITKKLDSLRTEERERRERIKSLEEKIKKWKHELANPPEIEDENKVADEMRKLNENYEETRQKVAFFQERQKRNLAEVDRAQREIIEASNGLKRLDNVEHQKLEALARWDPDTADTVRWIRKNKHLFQMEVIEPAAITLRVKDRNYNDAIEALFSSTQLRTFVVQCLEDSKMLNRMVNDTNEALGRKGRITVWYRPRQAVAPQPMSEDQLKALGFDCYAIDQIDCPDGLLWYLQKECNLHRAAIALDPRKVDTNVAMEAISNVQTGGQGNFIVGRVLNQVTRSSYGQRLTTNITRDVHQAKTLAGQQVDENAKRAFDERIAQARTRKIELEREQHTYADEEKELREAEDAFKRKNDDLKRRKEQIMTTRRRIAQLENQIRATETSVKKEKAVPGAEQAKTKYQAELFEIAKARVKSVRAYTDILGQIVKEQEESTQVNLTYVQIGANIAGLDKMIEQKDESYRKALEEFDKADKEYNAIKKVSKEKLVSSKAKFDEAEEEIQELFQQMESKLDPGSLDELQGELDNLQAQLELQAANNPGVLEQYERRKREIANLESTIETAERRESKIATNIKIAQDKWQPALERLVASIGQKFSAAFDRIGCAGEIRITQAPEYEKWAIDILVKFRDTEKLQLLTAQRQSGGERSLTTILYLMSLTEEARAPFSLVDEINQGMDQRAERAVHDQMVEVTCRPDSCQYFLITPKLLPGLKYHPLMKILCVNNGEWLPEQKGLGSMMRLIDNYRARASNAV